MVSTQAGLKVAFDDNQFGNTRTPTPSNKLDFLSFQDAYQKAEWEKMVPQENTFNKSALSCASEGDHAL
jgi:hypothetical protein